MERIVKRKRARWLRRMEADGLSPTLIRWALGPESVGLVPFRGLRSGGRPGNGAEPDRDAVAPVAARARRRKAAVIRAEATPRELALAVLGTRVEAVGDALFLDGAPAGVRDVVAAAVADGARIAYPGVRPLPAAYHSGPSYRGVRTTKPAKRRGPTARGRG